MNSTLKQLSPQAQCAKDIKAELKRAFPTVKFSIRSNSFSGGNSVDVGWDLGPTTRQVEAITRKYQAGWFDGMTDCYNYEKTSTPSNAKFVQIQRSVQQDLMKDICREYAELLGEPIPDGTACWNHRIVKHNEYITTLAHQLVGAFDLTAHGYQGIEHLPMEGTCRAANSLDEFYVMVGGTRQPRY